MFSWYFDPSDEAIKKIWDKGILTVDANVLLDLYRYHENTRNSLVQALQSFKGRLWISNQAATEFFRHRKQVIVSSAKGFRQASDDVAKLRKSLREAVDLLRNNRIISASIPEDIEKSTEKVLVAADKEIADAGAAYPDYLKKDPILDSLLSMFSKSVGAPFSAAESKSTSVEAEERKKKNIPPGYLDDEKDGDRPYGDYFVWRQILDHAKKNKAPMIFVTSERKEDWWERYSGQTLGPRQELLREAAEYSEQRVLIYQTDRFLEFANERPGRQGDARPVEEIRAAVEEIRAIDSLLENLRLNAVRVVSQSIARCSDSISHGSLAVELQRPVRNFTASGHFNPLLISIPLVRVRLSEFPPGVPPYRLGAGTGTVHDFNVHLKAEEPGVTLPTGIYVFEYAAECERSSPEGGTLK